MLNAMIVEAAKDNVIVAIEPIAKGDTVTYNCAGQEKSPVSYTHLPRNELRGSTTMLHSLTRPRSWCV